MGTAALTTRPRRRWQRIRTPVFRLSSLKDRTFVSGKVVRANLRNHANKSTAAGKLTLMAELLEKLRLALEPTKNKSVSGCESKYL